jgi:hypothetical protein
VLGSNSAIMSPPHPYADKRQQLVSSRILFGDQAAESSIPVLTSGVGSPESVVTAPRGSVYTDQSGGSGAVLYIKEGIATANTGWVAK